MAGDPSITERARERWWRELSENGDPLLHTDLFKAFDAGFAAGRAWHERPQMAPGQRYGRIVSIEFARRDRFRNALWRFRCDCGRETITSASAAKGGRVTSCGCAQREASSATLTRVLTKHGMSKTPIYKVWLGMVRRCTAHSAKEFADYGGRGITVCERWRQFENFYADMGARPSSKHSLDRINNDGDYEPGNCRWATSREQSLNRRKTKYAAFKGQTMPLALAAELSGIDRDVVGYRVRAGWKVDLALTTPVKSPVRRVKSISDSS